MNTQVFKTEQNGNTDNISTLDKFKEKYFSRYIIETSIDGELVECSDRLDLMEALNKMEDMWNHFWFDERNDWELEKIPNGFTNGYSNFILVKEIAVWK